jgi:hypothetical protein
MTADLRNFTPFANLRFSNLDSMGREFGVFMVKTAWDILEDGSCRLSDEQEPFIFSDQPFADGGTRYPSDLAPWKPATDLILNATAFAPAARPASAWEARVQVRDDQTGAMVIDRSLAISGPRTWRRRSSDWHLGEAKATDHVDLRYEHAFGGLVETGRDQTGDPVLVAFEENPVGIGFAAKDHLPADADVPEPLITLPGDRRQSPFDRMQPAGVGPVPAAWLPRRRLGGTYDQHWQDNFWPGWPTDYDFAFHNAASAGMTCRLAQGAGVEITLTHMHPSRDIWSIRLPCPPIVAHVATQDAITPTAMMTDTIFLDIARDRLSDPRAFQVSRLVFDLTQVQAILLAPRRDGADAASLAPPPRPDQVARFLQAADEDPEIDSEAPA